MRLAHLTALALSAAFVSTAAAGTGLASAPIWVADHAVCACLTNKQIDNLQVVLNNPFAPPVSIAAGTVITFSTDVPGGGAVACRVTRIDGASVSPKQLACSLTGLDAGGNVQVTVPVDQKLQN